MRNSYFSTFCQKYGITAVDLSAACDVSFQGAQNWVRGTSYPKTEYLIPAVNVFRRFEPGLTVDALLRREHAARKRTT